MNIQALKYELIEWVTQTKDNSLLEALKSIKDSTAATPDWFNNLTSEEKDSLNRGISDHSQGEVLNSKDFWAGHEDKL